MEQTVDQIQDEIESRREDLHSNLEELGQKVKSAVDWREIFRGNPGAALAVAFGGGFILAKVIGGSRSSGTEVSVSPSAGTALTSPVVVRKRQALGIWDDIQQALVGVAAAKVTKTLAEVVPGFREQLAARDDARRVNDAAGTH